MVDTKRIKERTKELLATFCKEYMKAYKTALVLSIRDAKNAKAVEGPGWELMLDQSSLLRDKQIEGHVFIGEEFKTEVHWSMARNFVVT
jgi:hypothetical protein